MVMMKRWREIILLLQFGTSCADQIRDSDYRIYWEDLLVLNEENGNLDNTVGVRAFLDSASLIQHKEGFLDLYINRGEIVRDLSNVTIVDDNTQDQQEDTVHPEISELLSQPASDIREAETTDTDVDRTDQVEASPDDDIPFVIPEAGGGRRKKRVLSSETSENSNKNGWILGHWSFLQSSSDAAIVKTNLETSLRVDMEHDQVFHCDEIVFAFGDSKVRLNNVFITAFTQESCPDQVVNPCPTGMACQIYEGNLACLETEYMSPIEREAYYINHVCLGSPVNPDTSTGDDSQIQATVAAPTTSDAVNVKDKLLWKGPNAFLQADNVEATIQEDIIHFWDDLGRPQYIESGGVGEEIARETSWEELSIERRLKFYFQSNGETFFDTDEIEEKGWQMYETRMYDDRPEWIYQNPGSESGIRVNSSEKLFHCDHVTFDYYTESDASQDSGRLVANDLFVGAFLPSDYDICSMDVYNPCTRNEEGKSYCSAINSVVSCEYPPETDKLTTSFARRSASCLAKPEAFFSSTLLEEGLSPKSVPVETTPLPIDQLDKSEWSAATIPFRRLSAFFLTIATLTLVQ